MARTGLTQSFTSSGLSNPSVSRDSISTGGSSKKFTPTSTLSAGELVGRLAPVFNDPDLEATFSMERSGNSSWLCRAAALSGAGASFALCVTTFFEKNISASWFLRGNLALDVVSFVSLALILPRAPHYYYDVLMPIVLLHLIAICSLTQDRIHDLLDWELPPPAVGFWQDASAGILVLGLLVSAVLFAQCSFASCVCLAHLGVIVYAIIQAFLGFVPKALFSKAGVFYRALLIYVFVLLAFVKRRAQETQERRLFAASGLYDTSRRPPKAWVTIEIASCSGRELKAPRPPPLELRERSRDQNYDGAPNSLLTRTMKGQQANWKRIYHMAENIRSPSYSLKSFFDDCVASFPELRLFFGAEDGPHVGPVRRRSLSAEGQSSSGATNEIEYQRTIGALFVCYWLLRLDIDGKNGFCYGVDDSWHEIVTKKEGLDSRRDSLRDNAYLRGIDSTQKSLDMNNFAKLSEVQKRLSFNETFPWRMFEKMVTQAGLAATERIVAMLCLSAFHDIMKIEELLPTVQQKHAPYQGYEEGVVIRDHDVALSYVLEHFPQVLPSFQGLGPAEQKSVIFTQSKLQFNHGWFVQAEAPPGAMLATFRSVLLAGATPADVSFYFFHWFTDLAGAEATPRGGAEKFVLKFPPTVLSAFLWSIPFLGNLTSHNETATVEKYLKARWQAIAPGLPEPRGRPAIACMRLVVMAQADETVLDAFQALPSQDRYLLADELARTGCIGQRFSSNRGLEGGPALLIYYSPALCQKNVNVEAGTDLFYSALRVLSQVIRSARELWPVSQEEEGATVTVNIAELKSERIDIVVQKEISSTGSSWVLIRHNNLEGSVKLVTANQLVELQAKGEQFCRVHLIDCLKRQTKETNSEIGSENEDGYNTPSTGRATELPDSALPDLGVGGHAAESELAKVRQEVWLLKSENATLREETEQLRMQLERQVKAAQAFGEVEDIVLKHRANFLDDSGSVRTVLPSLPRSWTARSFNSQATPALPLGADEAAGVTSTDRSLEQTWNILSI